MSHLLEVSDLAFTYPTTPERPPVLDGLSFFVEKGDIISFVGPSGCGKSTLLRTLAGLLEPDRGAVMMNGQKLAGPNRDIGMVFQRTTLFPWLTIRENVEFGLRSRMTDESAIQHKSLAWLEAVELAGQANDRPASLSGGMLQRASLARALAFEPKILLLDEPFGSLDALSRAEMQELLLKLWAARQMSIVLVTHDIDEAVTLSDRVLTLTKRPARIKFETVVQLPRPRMERGVRRAGFEEIRNLVARSAYSNDAGGSKSSVR